MRAPLAGYRVVDLSVDRGELCGRLLADLGAEVVKVEPPEGDRLRRQPPNACDGTSPAFQTLNANKESVAIAADSPMLQALIGEADILLTDQTTLVDHGIDLPAHKGG